jgi:restriction endonuclease S subunit
VSPATAQWTRERFRYLFSERSEKGFPEEELLAATQHAGVVPKSYLDFKTMEPVTSDLAVFKLVRKGDFVISLRSFEGGIEYSDHQGILSPAYTVLRPREKVDARFFRHLLKSQYFIQSLEKHKKGIRDGQAVPLSTLRDDYLTVPPLVEQERIANFLDEKTARIDALIAEKKRLATLLERSAADLIQHAVTKGTRDAKLAPSGRGWIGDMPAHWKVPFIRYVARLESGHTPSRQRPEWWENCTIPWFSLADVWQIRDGQREAVTETAELISELGLQNSSARLLPAGTVMVSRTASVGFSAIMGVPMATTQDFANWVCGPKILPEFLLYVFRAMGPEFERLKFGSTHATIYMPDIAKFTTPLPPLDEQREIVAFARARKARIEQLRAVALQAVDLLREYRSALISAAVTGVVST